MTDMMASDKEFAAARIDALYKKAISGGAGFEAVQNELGTVVRRGTKLQIFQDIACVCLAGLNVTWEVYEPTVGNPKVLFTGGVLP